jgi:hypothetical protein
MNKKLAIVALAVLAGGTFWAFQAQQQPNHIAAKDQAVATGKPAISAPVLKPAFPAQAVNQSWQAPQPSSNEPKLPSRDYGVTPRSTAQSLSSEQGMANLIAHKAPQKNAAQISSQIQGAAFDAEKWRTDPAYVAAYCATSEPSRATTCSPDPRSPALARVSEIAPEVHHGDRIELKVKTLSGYPVSWHSPSLGRFAESGLTSCTTLADADGYATVTFEGMRGTAGATEITAASPGSSGLVKFFVETLQSQQPASN